jgi:hypothetical protein
MHYKNNIKEAPKVNSDTFSSRAKQNAKLKAHRKLRPPQTNVKARTIVKRNKKITKDFTPKTPMNDMYKANKMFNAHNLQQSTRKTDDTPNVGSKDRTRGRSTISGTYDKARLFNPDNAINDSQISDDNKSQSDDNISKMKALFMTFKLNHDKIFGPSKPNTGKSLISNLKLPKVNEEPMETCQKQEEAGNIEQANQAVIPKFEVTNSHIMGCGMIKSILNSKLRSINRYSYTQIKEFEGNKEDLV